MDKERKNLGMDRDITRRDFLNASAVGVGAGLLSAAAPGQVMGRPTPKWGQPEVGNTWYGPGGIGACLSFKEFEDLHQRPWLIAFPDRTVGDLDNLIAEGTFVGASSMPGVTLTHTGPYLGHSATQARCGVNGIDFWSEGKDHGNIVHRKFSVVKGGKQAVIVSHNDWLSADGKKVCEDIRRLTFGAEGSSYWIDFDTTVTASEGPVKFGDTKEGSFGVRVAGSMKVTAKPAGHVINTHGDKDVKAWGKAAPWVDYYGTAVPKGKVVGIAIMNHPASFRYPTYWHVRTYGLFTANPFGLHHFKSDNSIDGSHQMKKGETMTLHYRVLIHPGDVKEGGVAEAFKEYSALEKMPLK